MAFWDKFLEENDKKEASEPLTPKEINTDLEPISEQKDFLSVEKIEKVEKPDLNPNKDMFLQDFESVLKTSRYKIILELNEKTPTRIKSGILQANKIKGYSNMTNEELDNEVSKLIANNILETLKGAENNGS